MTYKQLDDRISKKARPGWIHIRVLKYLIDSKWWKCHYIRNGSWKLMKAHFWGTITITNVMTFSPFRICSSNNLYQWVRNFSDKVVRFQVHATITRFSDNVYLNAGRYIWRGLYYIIWQCIFKEKILVNTYFLKTGRKHYRFIWIPT